MAARSSTTHVLGATIAGGIAGATLALLFAPRSGRETREMIKDGASRTQQDAKAKMNRAKSKVKEGVDSARDLKKRLSDAARDGGNKAKNIKDTADKRRRSVLSAWEEEV
jgi:gas vesicle protein